MSGAVCGGLLLLIIVFLLLEAWPAVREVGIARFFTDDAWQPSLGADGGFGALPMLLGSVLVTFGAMLLAGAVGLTSAIFCEFYAPTWFARQYRRMIVLLAGVPSVVFGFWGLTVLVPAINRIEPPGHSLLAAAIVLALMIVPTVMLTAQAALRGVSEELYRTAAALGMSRFAAVTGVILPAARRGILVGMLLATARAIGETMAVLMVAGNIVQIPKSPFEPVRAVTANIALEMGYAAELHRSALFVTGLMLVTVIAALVVAVELLPMKRRHA
jgi:phosphate transport system permease protein